MPSWLKRCLLVLGIASALIGGVPVVGVAASLVAPAGDGVLVQRTTDGIAHLQAASWRGLGHGVGYVQAEDALCTLADAFTTYAGERSLFHGTLDGPKHDSTFGKPRNWELDVFFRAVADAPTVERYREQLSTELRDLVTGYVRGYNRYLAVARAATPTRKAPSCLWQVWVRPIQDIDVYRRMIAAGLAGGYARFVSEIVGAAPPGASSDSLAEGGGASLAVRLRQPIGEHEGLGSNAVAFGRQATGENQALLFGNPHWYWRGPDRFYQMHLTIPGRINVAGVAFLGIPVVMIGFNERVAWTHTVSAARRFGLFQLQLEAGNPLAYLVDGTVESVRSYLISIPVRELDGKLGMMSRAVYRTRHGFVIDFGSMDPSFGWSTGHALTIRDVNVDNARIFDTFLAWGQATSLDDFIRVQSKSAAMPWVNTVAIARDDGRVWYADVGAVPDVPDELRERCATFLSVRFAQLDGAAPVLDGSRAACNWHVDPVSAQPGAMRADRLPTLLREDYVANMNDSYWASNPQQRLEGYPSNLGGERGALSMRGRAGHVLAEKLITLRARSARELARYARKAVLESTAYSAVLLKADFVKQVCKGAVPDVSARSPAGTQNTDEAQLHEGCRVLHTWSNRGDPQARGALLWEAVWAQLENLPASFVFQHQFAQLHPVHTPRGLVSDPSRWTSVLEKAIVRMSEEGLEPDAKTAEQRHVVVGERLVPIFGGCSDAGYFAVICNPNPGSKFSGANTFGNSYLQLVYFESQQVRAFTLLSHGQQETALAGGPGWQAVQRYAERRWLPFPFAKSDIERDPRLVRYVLSEQRDNPALRVPSSTSVLESPRP
jgi:acyl-homoserine-lactone acylase